MSERLFLEAHGYQGDPLALPVTDLEATAAWYAQAFGMQELERREHPTPCVIMARDEVQIGFAINGADPSEDGAAILVEDIYRAKAELQANGIPIANWRVDERDGKKYQVFFVVAPDSLCYYFHQQCQ